MKNMNKKAFFFVVVFSVMFIMSNLAFASGVTPAEDAGPRKILNLIVSWCSVIAMIVLVFYIVKDILALLKGNGSIGSIIVKVLCVFFLVGVMIFTKSFDGTFFAETTETVVDMLPSLD